ncbi:MAG TPA: hypothetical protein VNB06_13665 [Thermoanaerobaculia bacterium]|nr:hypothetical protein [Thermoanaerobaculia bacterium]
MSQEERSQKEPAAGPSRPCRSKPSRAQRDRPLREDCRYRKARMLVLLAYSATALPASSGVEPGSPTAQDLRRAAVAAGSTVIREHEGLPVPIEPSLGQLTEALGRGEREGWLDAKAAERLRRLSSELAAV